VAALQIRAVIVPTIVRRIADVEWQGWPAEQVAARGRVSWKDLLGSDPAEGADMVMGVARLLPGETLEPHRHSQPETYFALAGRGTVTIDGTRHDVEAGTLLFIPGDAEHGIRNDSDEELQILYAFAIADFNDVVYRF
jgi:quercetin dioxygenase-like cupin family protein